MRVRRIFAVALALAAFPAGTALAADFTPAPGDYTADTTALTLTGPGTAIAGTDEGGVAVFSFDSVAIPSGVTITATGSRPLLIRASGPLSLAGTIAGDGQSSVDSFSAGGPVFAGGPGGGAGGADTLAGDGPGGGGAQETASDGGGGGGFGGAGARGGVDVGTTPAAGGAPYGDLIAALQGGSGGAGGNTTGGGGGGGAIALQGSTVAVSSTGVVSAVGGGGAVADNGASGGGSGGGVLLRGDSITMDGALSVNGGDGGAGGCCGDGGGGGGGRIAYDYVDSISHAGTESVTGGTTGVRSTAGCCSLAGNSPDPTGADGVVTVHQTVPPAPPPAPAPAASPPAPAPAVAPVLPSDADILAGLKTPLTATVAKRRRSVRFTDRLPVGGRVHYGLDISFYRPSPPTGFASRVHKPIHIGSLSIASVSGPSQTVTVPIGHKGRRLLRRYQHAKLVLRTYYVRAADGRHFHGSRDLKVKHRRAFSA